VIDHMHGPRSITLDVPGPTVVRTLPDAVVLHHVVAGLAIVPRAGVLAAMVDTVMPSPTGIECISCD